MPRVSNVEIYFALASTSMGAIIEQQRRMPRREGGAVLSASNAGCRVRRRANNVATSVASLEVEIEHI